LFIAFYIKTSVGSINMNQQALAPAMCSCFPPGPAIIERSDLLKQTKGAPAQSRAAAKKKTAENDGFRGGGVQTSKKRLRARYSEETVLAKMERP